VSWWLVIGVRKKNINGVLDTTEDSKKAIWSLGRHNLHLVDRFDPDNLVKGLTKKGFFTASMLDTHN